jgi:hypothetical protein
MDSIRLPNSDQHSVNFSRFIFQNKTVSLLTTQLILMLLTER